ncbi:MAG TPA: nucleotidyltransferase domain-containing protein, partial [Nitrososphaera sp.]|nr:nucleotidyltransferase domain-containing protein [Nitrososphaera sp.]
MFSLTESELEAAKKCVAKVSNRYKVAAACVYGSKAAGYARPNSDIDLLVVLEGYPFAIKYSYIKEGTSDISLLIISKNSLEADARRASLGEFAVGRLLHVYEPIVNGEF